MLSAAIMGPWLDCSRTRLEPMASAGQGVRLREGLFQENRQRRFVSREQANSQHKLPNLWGNKALSKGWAWSNSAVIGHDQHSATWAAGLRARRSPSSEDSIRSASLGSYTMSSQNLQHVSMAMNGIIIGIYQNSDRVRCGCMHRKINAQENHACIRT